MCVSTGWSAEKRPSPVASERSGAGFLKRAQKTVRLIEEDLIARGWPVGLCYGSEREIADRHNVAALTVREAIRILQWRGCARMRRGPRGGMVVEAPSASSLVQAMGDQLLRLGVSAAQAREAFATLQRLASEDAAVSSDEAIIVLWTQCAKSLLERLEPVPQNLTDTTTVRANCDGSMSQAAAVAQALTEAIGGAKCVAGQRLGSEVQLCERYAVSRTVMRQAVRILEEGGWVQTRRGRGRGLETRGPEPAAMAPLLHGYLIAHRISAQASREAYLALDVEVAALPLERNPILAFLRDSLPAVEDARRKIRRAGACYTTAPAGSTPALQS